MTLLRKTTQFVLPVEKPETGVNQYDIYPAHDLGEEKIFCDYMSLARRIAGSKRVIIDGYVGVRFDIFSRELNKALETLGIRPVWWNTGAAMKEPAEIDRLIEPYLGGDEIQFRSRAGSITNLGAAAADAPKKMYKRFYFVDWVVLNRHKKALLPKIDVMIDGQRETEITWTEGADLRRGLDRLAGNGFRVRPWFEPGAWGGQWIRNHIEALPHDVPNYAWSFELIVPENGLIFRSSGRMLEVSFDTVMFQAGERVVGKECYGLYGDEFPIRMDYLDNFDGGNLSIQCHPQREYIRKNFGEVLTQEETYYILNTTPDSVVYLGFKEDIVPEKFEQALTESFEKGTELDVNKYVNAEPSAKHDLFLMPPGTLHSSGRNNLVLEISTTPYIFTFKMYDWLALDLDGKPRPLNIRRAMESLCFDRKGETVKRELIAHPELLEKGADWELWHLPTHRNHSYDVHRYKLDTSVEVQTEGKCHVLNLVEGESARIETAGGDSFPISYAETFVVSAAAGSYRIVNTSGREIMVVKAFMK